MTVEPAPFYTIEEVARIRKISATQVVNLIETGQLKAERFGATHRATRIAHTIIFPGEPVVDLKSKRMKRLILDLKRRQEVSDRLYREWSEAQLRTQEAVQALYDEMGLQEIDAAAERAAS